MSFVIKLQLPQNNCNQHLLFPFDKDNQFLLMKLICDQQLYKRTTPQYHFIKAKNMFKTSAILVTFAVFASAKIDDSVSRNHNKFFFKFKFNLLVNFG